jgi:50S ribosomal protein L16 3-hydroxylase
MAPAPIEVAGAPGRPLGMAPARFLRDYWQKRPLLIRGGFPQFHNALAADDLAGLACEPAALARLVLRDEPRDRWSVRNGPFAEGDFATLPARGWTLLVQDVDKWDADVAALLDAFAFLPAWRLDDVMVSHAEDGGGVGAHVDHYDVFLVQGSGRRRWRIDASSARERPADAFRADTELKLLRRFTPTHEWLLEPGDALYLPPGIAHDGVAVGTCMTFSVGMRAPAVAELVLDFAEALAEPMGETPRYGDPDLRPPRHRHEIDGAALRRVQAALSVLRDTDADALRSWFGRFITRYRSAHEAMPRERTLSAQQVAARLARGALVRNPWSRIAWTAHGRGTELFVAGEAWRCTRVLAQRLCAGRQIEGDVVLRQAGARGLELVAALVNAGHFALVGKPRPRPPR